MPTVPDIHRRGTRADQATIAAPPLTVGTLYFVTDEGLTERWDGSAWESYSGTSAVPTAHAASHQNGGSDELSVTGLSGLLADGQTPLAHTTTHQSGGSDAMPLDTLGAPTDVTTLNATASAHGLLRKLSGTATQYLDGSGAWTVPAGSGGTGDVVGPAASVDGEIALFDSTTGKLLKRATGTGPAKVASGVLSAAAIDLSGSEVTGTLASARLATQQKTRAITVVFGTGSAVITAGLKTYVSCPYTGTITAARLLAVDASVTSGSIVIDVWKDTYANFPPAVADTITASAKPTLSSATKSDDTTLTGWTTAVTAGDVFGFTVDSASTVTQVALQLTLVLT